MRRRSTIPSILGILLLLGGVALGVVGISERRTFFIKASPEEQPKEVRVTNVTDTAFTISWVTDSKVAGFIKYGKSGGSLPEIAEDEKDGGASNQGVYDVHYVTVDGLTPSETYEFKIGSGKRIYDNSGKAYSLETAPVLQAELGQTDLVTGRVETSAGGAAGAVVYLEHPRLTPLSSTVKSSGVFTISLTGARTRDLRGAYQPVAEEETFELLIEGGILGKATGLVNMKNRENLPPISIPGTYDFSEEFPRDSGGAIILPSVIPISPAGEATPTPIPASKFSFANLPPPTESEEVTVLSPSALDTVEVTQPEISGLAPPGSSLTVTVESAPQSQQVTSDVNGRWAWTVPSGLAVGEHTLTISFVDKNGDLQKIVRKFTVSSTAIEGTERPPEQISEALTFTASPSATLTPVASPSPTPTGLVSPSPTGTPTVVVSPTERAALPLTDDGVPQAGTWEVTLLLVGLGVLLLGSGFALLITGTGNKD